MFTPISFLLCLFVFESKDRTGHTDERTDTQADGQSP